MSEPRYPYLHVDVTALQLEEASSALFDLGALGIEERDASTLLKSGGGEEASTLVASFEDDATALAAQAELAAQYAVRLEYVVGDAWRDGWRAYFKPLRVGERLVVKPSWEAFEAGPDDLVLTLDPGQAFGTGTHESTQLILRTLPGCVAAGARVLDVGTGSGILAIASVLFGASHVDAIDNDPLAVTATRENAAANGVSDRIAASVDPLESLRSVYPLVLANIEARVLVPLAPVLSARVAPGGQLLMSGLLHADADRVRAEYPVFRECARPKLGDWCALVLQREA
jgi:ribosomal protein L11 methyltransferase